MRIIERTIYNLTLFDGKSLGRPSTAYFVCIPFLTSITTGHIQMSKHALAISDKQSAREHSPTELIPTSMFSCGRREIPSHTGASTTPITPTFPSLTTPSLSVSLRHPVPTWKVLEYCEIIISHNWKGIYVTTKAKDIAEDKGTSEDILRSPAKRPPVPLLIEVIERHFR